MAKIDGYELLPCPFCGGDNLSIQHEPLGGSSVFFVICEDQYCMAEGPWDLGRSGAIERWNERHEVTP